MEPQKNCNNQSNPEKKKIGQSWRCHPPWIQMILQSCSNQNTIVPAQKHIQRSMEENRQPRNKTMHENESVSCSVMLTLCDPIAYSSPGSSVMEFSRQEYWNRLPLPSFRGSSQPQVSNLGLLHCWRILHLLNHQGSPHAYTVH